jgi:hypothetical protein
MPAAQLAGKCASGRPKPSRCALSGSSASLHPVLVLVLDVEFEPESSFGQLCVESERDAVPDVPWLAVGVDDCAHAVPAVPTASAPRAMLEAIAALRRFNIISLTSFLVRSTPRHQTNQRSH